MARLELDSGPIAPEQFPVAAARIAGNLRDERIQAGEVAAAKSGAPAAARFAGRRPAFAVEPVVFMIICLPAVERHNRLCPMAEPAHATVTTPVPLSQTKVIVIKIIALTVISVVLILGQSWASTRFYRPDYAASFPTGLLEGALMPAALPGLLGGKDVPIYAPNNDGRGYKIGFILGLNTCGTFFFGVAFWQPRRRKP